MSVSPTMLFRIIPLMGPKVTNKESLKFAPLLIIHLPKIFMRSFTGIPTPCNHQIITFCALLVFKWWCWFRIKLCRSLILPDHSITIKRSFIRPFFPFFLKKFNTCFFYPKNTPNRLRIKYGPLIN